MKKTTALLIHWKEENYVKQTEILRSSQKAPQNPSTFAWSADRVGLRYSKWKLAHFGKNFEKIENLCSEKNHDKPNSPKFLEIEQIFRWKNWSKNFWSKRRHGHLVFYALTFSQTEKGKFKRKFIFRKIFSNNSPHGNRETQFPTFQKKYGIGFLASQCPQNT